MRKFLDQGVVCVLGREHAKRAFSARDNEALLAALNEALESAGSDQVAACNSLWEPLHRCLAIPVQQPPGTADPAAAALLGGRHLQRGPGLIVSMVRPDMVPIIADALAALVQADFAARCEQLDEAESDRLWQLLTQMATVYRRAAHDRAAVVFAATSDLDEMQ